MQVSGRADLHLDERSCERPPVELDDVERPKREHIRCPAPPTAPARGVSRGNTPPAWLLGAVVGLASLGIYAATLAPGLTWAHDSVDGGELAAAAYVLGIPHPPGYPTYVLLAHLFTLLPIGEIATRTNLFSATCAAAASALLAWSLARSGKHWIGAGGAGLALALSPLLWSQATVTEVHALNGFFAALLLALAATLRGEARGKRAALLAATVGVLWGLSLGNHPTAWFCAPLALLAWRRQRWSGPWPLAGFLGGLAIYVYLPLRAAASPPINWGNPRSLQQFWWVCSAKPYRQFLFALPAAHLGTRLLAWSSLLAQQFGWAGLPVAILGFTALWNMDRPLAQATGWTTALCSILSIGYNTSDSYLYLIPALVCMGWWFGAGLDWLLNTLGLQRWWVGAVLLLSLIALAHRLPHMDLSQERAIYAFEQAVLEAAPERAIILSNQDAHTFALWYLQYARQRRADVTTIDLDLIGYDWYTDPLAQQLACPPGMVCPLGSAQEVAHTAAILNHPLCRIDAQGTALQCRLE
jgi:hypothetical protein